MTRPLADIDAELRALRALQRVHREAAGQYLQRANEAVHRAEEAEQAIRTLEQERAALVAPDAPVGGVWPAPREES